MRRRGVFFALPVWLLIPLAPFILATYAAIALFYVCAAPFALAKAIVDARTKRNTPIPN